MKNITSTFITRTRLLAVLAIICGALGFIGARSVDAEGDAGGGVPAKHYQCAFFVVDHLQSVAPFTITGPGTYTDRDGKKGTYSFDSGSSTLTFHGGSYDGQRAEYDPKTKHIHILGPSGRRVIECN
jgi:hypothetical protein